MVLTINKGLGGRAAPCWVFGVVSERVDSHAWSWGGNDVGVSYKEFLKTLS